MRNAAETVLTRILADPPRKFRTVIVTNAAADSYDVPFERVTEAGTVTDQVQPLDLAFPPGIFSLSHVALPFPMDDSLYGMQAKDRRVLRCPSRLDCPARRARRLILNLDALLRVSSNPFFPYLLKRIEQGIANSPR